VGPAATGAPSFVRGTIGSGTMSNPKRRKILSRQGPAKQTPLIHLRGARFLKGESEH
jgi:hypothetical protein